MKALCKQFFFETIKIQDFKICNLKYHNNRLNKTRYEIFGKTNKIDLSKLVVIPNMNNIIKCRVLYKEEVHCITYSKYHQKKVFSFLMIQNNDIFYPHKSNNRKHINSLLEGSNCDEVLIFKNNLLTDTSISNIAIFQNNTWLTPRHPLLRGTMLESMLGNSLLKSADISKEMFKNANKVAILNAMIGFFVIDNFVIEDL